MTTPAATEKMRVLRDELANTQPTAEVVELREHIEKALNDPARPHYVSLTDRLRRAYVGFQLEHPKLAAAIDDVMNELAAAGL